VPSNPTPDSGQLRRRFTLGSGPLKRGSDRLEFLARVLLLCSVITAVPISLVAGSLGYTQAQEQAAKEAADRHPVPARMLEDASVPPGAVSDTGGAWDNQAGAQGNAMWTDPAGIEHQWTVAVPIGTRAGDPVTVWLDEAGNRTQPPMAADDVTGRAVSQGTGTFTLLALMAGGAYLWFRALLNRSRARRWAADWARIEPVWSRVVP
jgi:hypothetical protein